MKIEIWLMFAVIFVALSRLYYHVHAGQFEFWALGIVGILSLVASLIEGWKNW